MPRNHCFLTISGRGLKFLKGRSPTTVPGIIQMMLQLKFREDLKTTVHLTLGLELTVLPQTPRVLMVQMLLTFSNLQINTTGTISLLTNNITVSNLLTMTSGNINTGSYKVIMNQNTSGALVWTSGKIIGKLQRAIGTTGSEYLYPVGTAANYNPAKITFNTWCGFPCSSIHCGRHWKFRITGQ